MKVADRAETVGCQHLGEQRLCSARMYASGATSITPALISFGISSGSIMS
ncbi:hypothetical protein I552_9625 [Mycobacterium xenopi 3993]|nr:hypothetical protein I552_9625 [Mycobacterium xenopi 3993]